jgi:hypothetical protein
MASQNGRSNLLLKLLPIFALCVLIAGCVTPVGAATVKFTSTNFGGYSYDIYQLSPDGNMSQIGTINETGSFNIDATNFSYLVVSEPNQMSWFNSPDFFFSLAERSVYPVFNYGILILILLGVVILVVRVVK